MMSNRIIVYIKGEMHTEVYERVVLLEDILDIESNNRILVNKLKKKQILKIPQRGPYRYVISVLRIIECIHREFPSIEVVNEGEKDLIISYKEDKVQNFLLHIGKVCIISGVTFLGAAFSIMSFNNDVSITRLFGQIYKLVMGQPTDGFTTLEFAYSIGLIIGILTFFNHFGKKKFGVDPTPIEVEMRMYEKEIDETIIENYSRKGQEIDVGQESSTGRSGA